MGVQLGDTVPRHIFYLTTLILNRNLKSVQQWAVSSSWFWDRPFTLIVFLTILILFCCLHGFMFWGEMSLCFIFSLLFIKKKGWKKSISLKFKCWPDGRDYGPVLQRIDSSINKVWLPFSVCTVWLPVSMKGRHWYGIICFCCCTSKNRLKVMKWNNFNTSTVRLAEVGFTHNLQMSLWSHNCFST